ncbi:hypothetical protein AB0G42_22295 [Streptomyces yangpuensis]
MDEELPAPLLCEGRAVAVEDDGADRPGLARRGNGHLDIVVDLE